MKLKYVITKDMDDMTLEELVASREYLDNELWALCLDESGDDHIQQMIEDTHTTIRTVNKQINQLKEKTYGL